MKHLLLSSAAAVALMGAVHAQNLTIQGAVEDGIAQINEDGANLTFASSAVGADNSLTLRGVRMEPDEADLVIEADFVTLTPSTEVSGDVIITLADVVTLTSTAYPDAEPVEYTMASSGLEITTNGILEDGGQTRFAMTADSLEVRGGSEDDPIVKGLMVSQTDLEVRAEFDEATRNASAS
ncbi:MAG: hypothetical protein AAFV27_11465, partial [Pseudomonadota bacterium]